MRSNPNPRVLMDGSNSISQIIRKSVTTQADLEKLARRLHMDVKFDWLDNVDPNAKLQILNTDADHIGGTHWIAIYDNDFYFDPLGLPIARDNLDHLQYTTIPIQDYRHGGCGLYSLLFLYFANEDEMDKFYNLFT